MPTCAALTEAKKQADDAGVEAEPEDVDPSAVLKEIIDESLKEDEGGRN